MIDADVLHSSKEVDKRRDDAAPAHGRHGADEPKIKNEKDLADYESILTDTAYWKKVGEEYQSPLIITGSMLFTEISRSGVVSTPAEYTDQYGQHRSRERPRVRQPEGVSR